MKIKQLYRAMVPNELFVRVYKCFGYEVLVEDYTFCKADLQRLETVNKMSEIRDELCQYYIPCKAKLYLTSMNVSKCITILRQLLRLYNIALLSKQRYIRHKKTTFYSIRFSENNEDSDINHMRVENNHMVVHFE
jgi:hypothetical protein